jgi:hypothetical protein
MHLRAFINILESMRYLSDCTTLPRASMVASGKASLAAWHRSQMAFTSVVHAVMRKTLFMSRLSAVFLARIWDSTSQMPDFKQASASLAGADGVRG